jgi:hypothetical protein
VLGVLAILAVVGIAMVTMSGVDSRTAHSFAIQTQMRISADAAVAYVCHDLVDDCWEWDGDIYEYERLLTGEDENEPFDMPGAPHDVWLASPLANIGSPTTMSYEGTSSTVFKISDFETAGNEADRDCLGFPVGAGQQHPTGVWVSDLASPFDSGVVRVAITVLDHGALTNVNAHGYGGAPSWEYSNAADAGAGYFICEVDPVNIANESGLTTGAHGRWRSAGGLGDGVPGIPETGETLIEKAYLADQGRRNLPFTLAEEFELRRPRGTAFTSRLEQIWPELRTEPASENEYAAEHRLGLTTVSWTAEVQGDRGLNAGDDHLTGPGGSWSARKIDLNTDDGEDIYNALKDHGIIDDDNDIKQIVANILAYRDKDNEFENDYAGFIGAERQPFFSEISAVYSQQVDSEGNPEKEIWTFKFELYNPWPGDNPWVDTLSMKHLEIEVVGSGATKKGSTPLSLDGLTMPADSVNLAGVGPALWEYDVVVNKPAETIAGKLKRIRLNATPDGRNLPVDQVSSGQVRAITQMAKAGGAGNHVHGARRFSVVAEQRGPQGDQTPVLYVGGWENGSGEGDLGTKPERLPSVAGLVPIRVMNSVDEDYEPSEDGPLPIYKTAGRTSYKAFARLGELNRVMAVKGLGGNNFWAPAWVLRITESGASDRQIKFDWRAWPEAADFFCVGGPWADGIDNDGDGSTDDEDKGLIGEGQGRHAGPEVRVAGKVNINTATEDTLRSMLGGVNLNVAPNAIMSQRPFDTIGRLAQIGGNAGNEAMGDVEAEDIVLTRLSNIATTRSDVFSIYGVVQFVELPSGGGNNVRVLRSRRFWSLVDRSPVLAYSPSTDNYLPPRVLNFQWID